jgi:hypothetical protein
MMLRIPYSAITDSSSSGNNCADRYTSPGVTTCILSEKRSPRQTPRTAEGIAKSARKAQTAPRQWCDSSRADRFHSLSRITAWGLMFAALRSPHKNVCSATSCRKPKPRPLTKGSQADALASACCVFDPVGCGAPLSPRSNPLSFVQGADDRPQYVISHLLGCLGSGEPLEFALALLQPAGFLSLHFQGKDLDLAGDNLPAFQTLLI